MVLIKITIRYKFNCSGFTIVGIQAYLFAFFTGVRRDKTETRSHDTATCVKYCPCTQHTPLLTSCSFKVVRTCLAFA